MQEMLIVDYDFEFLHEVGVETDLIEVFLSNK